MACFVLNCDRSGVKSCSWIYLHDGLPGRDYSVQVQRQRREVIDHQEPQPVRQLAERLVEGSVRQVDQRDELRAEGVEARVGKASRQTVRTHLQKETTANTFQLRDKQNESSIR
jgi:hypothetical protein